MTIDNTTKAFFALLRAGLWETDVQLLPYGEIDITEIYRLAEEQSALGIVAAGINHVTDTTIPKKELLPFVGVTLQLEERNKAMNRFIGLLVGKLQEAGIHSLLVKGQGVAQCYEKPLWRTCGDVDLFLSEENYAKAKEYLMPLADSVEPEGIYTRHLGMTFDPWVVELHGSLRCGLSRRLEKELDGICDDTFRGGHVRAWDNDGVHVLQLSVENDAFYIFTHFLNHFYKGGLGVRQICDWCRLLWTYRESLDVTKLASRVCSAGLMTVWKAFGAFAVEYLGLPTEALPFYSPEKKWKRKAKLISDFVIKSGNFGHNRDTSYYSKYPYIIRKMISMGVRIADLMRHARLFPLDSMKFFPRIMFNGFTAAVRGE